MFNRSIHYGLLAGAALTFALAAAKSIAATPSSPTRICINNDCQADPGTPSPSGRAVKFHPGIYAYYTPGSNSTGPGHRWDLIGQRTQLLGFIDTICNDTAIKGISILPVWRTLEGDTPGDYSAGFAAVDIILAKLASCNKYLMLNLQAAWFGNIGGNDQLYPLYIINGASYGISGWWDGSAGSSARVWQQATADRLIALSAAYGARYNSKRNFEMFTLYGETALRVGGDGYSTAALSTQIQRAYAAARGHWPNTGLKLFVNDLGDDASWVDLYSALKTYYVSPSNPDTWPGDITTSDRMFVGMNSAGAFVYEDLRDKIPWTANVDWQSFNLSGAHPIWTLQQLWNVHNAGYDPTNGQPHMPSMKARYAAWYVNESNGNSENQWSTAEKAFLLTHPVLSTTCPTLYPACDTAP